VNKEKESIPTISAPVQPGSARNVDGDAATRVLLSKLDQFVSEGRIDELEAILRDDNIHSEGFAAIKPYFNGIVELVRGNPEHALGLGETIDRLPMLAWRGPLLRGTALHALGRYREAVAHLRQVGMDSPGWLQAVSVEIKCLLALDDVPEATSRVESALASDPDASELWYLKGLVVRQAGDSRTASLALMKAIELASDFRDPLRALKFSIVGHPDLLDEAIRVVEATRGKKKGSRLILSTLSALYQERGNIEKSAQLNAKFARKLAITKIPSLAKAEWPDRKSPSLNFIIIGAPKCGTTSLFGYLARHPQAVCPHTKEINYFNFKFELGLEWYLSHFPAICDCQPLFTGEASPGYFAAKGADDRIRHQLAPVKLILMLRNPADRTISSYFQKKKMQGIKADLEIFVRSQIREKLAGSMDLDYGGGPLAVSTYGPKLKRWMGKFGKDELLVVNADRFFSNTQQEMDRIHAFLGMHPLAGDYPVANMGAYSKDNDAVRAMLVEHFRPEIPELDELLGEKTYWDEM